jgi:hypothetical protein
MTQRTEAIEEAILAGLMSGRSLRSICVDDGMPDRSTVFRWMASDDEFATKCARARVIQADAIEDDMADIEERTLTGEINPAASRAVLASKQWRASKLSPKKYGDKLELGGGLDVNTRIESITRRIMRVDGPSS